MEFIDLFDTTQPEELLRDYCSRAKPGADKINYEKFAQNFSKTKTELKNRIVAGKYKFTRFELTPKVKTHNKLPRPIFKCTIRDRLVAKLMCIHMQEHSSVPLRQTRSGILEQIKETLQSKCADGEYRFNYYLRLDISSYFDSINRSLLRSQLEHDCYDTGFLYLVDKLFTTMDISMIIPSGAGVPQGISVSSLLAERYLLEFDQKYTSAPYNNFLAFFRYVDDILILVQDKKNLDQIRKQILFELVSTYGLSINPDKISDGCLNQNIEQLNQDTDRLNQYINQLNQYINRVDYLGVTLYGRTLEISESQIRRVEQQLNELFLQYRRSLKTKNTHLLQDNSPRALTWLIARLNLLITGYTYSRKNGNNQTEIGRYGWIQTSLPRQVQRTDRLKDLDRHVGALIHSYLQASDSQAVQKQCKSFYKAYQHCRYKPDSEYIPNLERIAQDPLKMYRLTCDLSLVDIKYGFPYDTDKVPENFAEKVGKPLKTYFRNTMYIANRNLTSNILYW